MKKCFVDSQKHCIFAVENKSLLAYDYICIE